MLCKIPVFIYYLFIFFSFTPYQYTYLNKFIGNLSNAHKKFENDYWAVSIKELVNQIANSTAYEPVILSLENRCSD